MTYSKHPYFVMHLVILLWGITAIFGKMTTVNAITLVWWRMGIASICLYLPTFFSKKDFHFSAAVKLKAIGVGSLIALHWIFFFHAIKVSNISLTLAILTSGGFMVSIIEPLFFRRKIIKYELLLGLISIILFIGILDVRITLQRGILYAFLATFLSSLFSVLNGKLSQKYSARKITFYEMLGGFAFTSVYLVCLEFPNYERTLDSLFLSLQPIDIISIICLGTLCTAFAFSVSIWVLKYISPYTSVLAANLEPVYAIILGYLIFGESEKMSLTFYVCTAFLIGIVFLDNLLKKKKKIPFLDLIIKTKSSKNKAVNPHNK